MTEISKGPPQSDQIINIERILPSNASKAVEELINNGAAILAPEFLVGKPVGYEFRRKRTRDGVIQGYSGHSYKETKIVYLNKRSGKLSGNLSILFIGPADRVTYRDYDTVRVGNDSEHLFLFVGSKSEHPDVAVFIFPKETTFKK